MISTSNEFIPLGAPSIGLDDINEVTDSLKSGWIGTGPKVSIFEKNFEVSAKRRVEKFNIGRDRFMDCINRMPSPPNIS